MRFRCVCAHLVSVGLVQAVYRPVCALPAQTIPWPAAAPVATEMSCQPFAARQVKLLSVAYVVPIAVTGRLPPIRSPSGAAASSTRMAVAFQANASWRPSADQRRTRAVYCQEPPAGTFAAISSPDAGVDHSRSSAPVAVE